MKPTFRHVVGSFRIIRRRAVEVSRPGLAMWADAGERAAVGVSTRVRDTAHRAEVTAREIVAKLRRILADGKVTPKEIAELKAMVPEAERVAEHCHDTTEVAAP